MTILLIIVAVTAAVYIYAAVGYYYGFRNWYPLCGCKGATCEARMPSKVGHAQDEHDAPAEEIRSGAQRG